MVSVDFSAVNLGEIFWIFFEKGVDRAPDLCYNTNR